MKKTILPIIILFFLNIIFLASASLPESMMTLIFPNYLGVFPIGIYLLALTSLLSSLVLLIFHLYRLR